MRIIERLYTNKNHVLNYFLTLLMIISSKTLFFGIIYQKLTIHFTLVVFLIVNMIIKKNMVKKRMLQIYFIFCVLLLFVSLFHIEDIVYDTKSYLGALVFFAEILVIGMLFANIVNREEFAICYVNIMAIISCISLFFYFWLLIDQSSAISASSIFISGRSKYIANPLYTYGWQYELSNGYIYNSIFFRNAGPFWEPGGFQGFIVIGLFFLINYKHLFKKTKILMIIFLVTILTTQSTTAYIIIIISFIGIGKKYADSFFTDNYNGSQKNRYFNYFITLIILLLIAFFVIYSNTVSNKFSEDNGSYIARSNDINTALSTMLYNPFAGIGLGKTGAELSNRVTVSATTILSLIESFGIPFALLYTYFFFKGCIQLFKPENLFQKIMYICCFFLILMSETLYYLPLYAFILFASEQKCSKNNY